MSLTLAPRLLIGYRRATNGPPIGRYTPAIASEAVALDLKERKGSERDLAEKAELVNSEANKIIFLIVGLVLWRFRNFWPRKSSRGLHSTFFTVMKLLWYLR